MIYHQLLLKGSLLMLTIFSTNILAKDTCFRFKLPGGKEIYIPLEKEKSGGKDTTVLLERLKELRVDRDKYSLFAESDAPTFELEKDKSGKEYIKWDNADMRYQSHRDLFNLNGLYNFQKDGDLAKFLFIEHPTMKNKYEMKPDAREELYKQLRMYGDNLKNFKDIKDGEKCNATFFGDLPDKAKQEVIPEIPVVAKQDELGKDCITFNSNVSPEDLSAFKDATKYDSAMIFTADKRDETGNVIGKDFKLGYMNLKGDTSLKDQPISENFYLKIKSEVIDKGDSGDIFDAKKFVGINNESGCVPQKSAKKIVYSDGISNKKCTIKRTVQEGKDWKSWNGYDVFSNNPHKYLGHIHGKDEGTYFNQKKYEQCQQEDATPEVVIKEEFKECEWVEYQEWYGQLGCKTEKTKICSGRVICKNPDQVYSVMCQSESDVECSASKCASDPSMSMGDKTYNNEQYKLKVEKVKVE